MPIKRRRAWLVACAALLCVSLALAERLGLSEKLIAYVAQKYGVVAKQRLLDWQQLMVVGNGEMEVAKLQRVNQFFNQVEFVSDLKHWGKDDYWATPVEMLATNGGDCIRG